MVIIFVSIIVTSLS